jgi:hypothetical protein
MQVDTSKHVHDGNEQDELQQQYPDDASKKMPDGFDVFLLSCVP